MNSDPSWTPNLQNTWEGQQEGFLPQIESGRRQTVYPLELNHLETKKQTKKVNQRTEKQGQLKAVGLKQGDGFCFLPPLQGYLAMSDNIKGMEWFDYNLIQVERQPGQPWKPWQKLLRETSRAQPSRTWETG